MTFKRFGKRQPRFFGDVPQRFFRTKRRPTVKAVAKRVRRLERGEELSMIEVAIATRTPGTTANIIPLSYVAVGDTQIARDGQEIQAKSIRVDLELTVHASNTAHDIVRIMIVRINDTKGSLPVVGDILATEDVLSLKDSLKQNEFKVFLDRIVCITSEVNDTNSIKYYKKLNHKMTYTGTGADEASMGTNMYFLILLAKENTNKTSIRYVARTQFKEG